MASWELLGFEPVQTVKLTPAWTRQHYSVYLVLSEVFVFLLLRKIGEDLKP